MHKIPKIYFISGVSGVGKTSTLNYLKKFLPIESFDVRDFDERGVPDGGGPKWHSAETANWLDTSALNVREGKSTIVCGFSEPDIVRAVHKENHPPAELILLHASTDILKKRLRGRYPTTESEKEIERSSGASLEKFVENCASYAPKLRDIFKKEKCLIIDTDDKSPEEVAHEISSSICS